MCRACLAWIAARWFAACAQGQKCAGMLLHWLYALEDCTDAQLTIRHLHQGIMQGLHAAYNNMHQLSTARHNLD